MKKANQMHAEIARFLDKMIDPERHELQVLADESAPLDQLSKHEPEPRRIGRTKPSQRAKSREKRAQNKRNRPGRRNKRGRC